jgi:hypothetical protein
VFTPDRIDCTSQVVVGGDYTSGETSHTQTPTVGACAMLCAGTSIRRCVAWTWRPALRNCSTTYTLTGRVTKDKDAISGLTGSCGPSRRPPGYGRAGIGMQSSGGAALLGVNGSAQYPPSRQRAYVQYGVRQRTPKPAPAPAAPGGAAGGGAAAPASKLTVPGELQAVCKKLSLDAAFDNAIEDVSQFAKDMEAQVVTKFATDLTARKEAVRTAFKAALKGVAPGDKKALEKAIVGAVAAVVPSAKGGAVLLDGWRVGFANLMWESLSTDCF